MSRVIRLPSEVDPQTAVKSRVCTASFESMMLNDQLYSSPIGGGLSRRVAPQSSNSYATACSGPVGMCAYSISYSSPSPSSFFATSCSFGWKKRFICNRVMYSALPCMLTSVGSRVTTKLALSVKAGCAPFWRSENSRSTVSPRGMDKVESAPGVTSQSSLCTVNPA